MAGRANIIQTNFTAGEISPRMYGRVDVARYNAGAKTIENCRVLAHGGCNRRGGTRFIAEIKNSANKARLIPFVFNVEQAYMLEFGAGYVRFYKDLAQITSGGPAYEITNPYSAVQFPEVDYVQGADTMFLAQADIAQQRLRRFDHASWTLDAVPFTAKPFAELGLYPATTLTLSLATVGAGRTFTAGAAAFQPSDVGRTIEAGGGLATITGYTSTTVVTGTIDTAFPTVGPHAANAWFIGQSPNTTCTPSAKDPVGASITLTLGAGGWRATDVGSYVEINDGICLITGYTSATIVTATIKQVLAATVAAPGFAWTVNPTPWNARDGYPRSVSLHQQRLWYGGSPGFPQEVWGSKIGEYLNFELGIADDNACDFGVVSDQINPIRHIATIRALACLTYGGEFTLHGGVEFPITPTNAQVKDQSANGCNSVAPVRVGNELCYVNRSGRKLRALSADRFDAGNYASPDLTILAEHITESGIIDMDFQADAEPWLYAVRADGQIACMTIDRDQDVIAWARERIGGSGLVEAVGVIPYGTGEQVWLIVKRTLSGVTRRFIEVIDDTLNTDSAVTGTSGPGASVWGGLTHLIGQTIDVVLDGADMGTFVVSGAGQVTLPRTGFVFQGGLNYVSKIEMLPPEIPTPTGSIQALPMRAYKISVLLKDTAGCWINGVETAFRQFGEDVLDSPVTPRSGYVYEHNFIWEEGDMPITIEQRRPLGFHCLAVVRAIEVGD